MTRLKKRQKLLLFLVLHFLKLYYQLLQASNFNSHLLIQRHLRINNCLMNRISSVLCFSLSLLQTNTALPVFVRQLPLSDTMGPGYHLSDLFFQLVYIPCPCHFQDGEILYEDTSWVSQRGMLPLHENNSNRFHNKFKTETNTLRNILNNRPDIMIFFLLCFLVPRK